jgi:hypothetical protein
MPYYSVVFYSFVITRIVQGQFIGNEDEVIGDIMNNLCRDIAA